LHNFIVKYHIKIRFLAYVRMYVGIMRYEIFGKMLEANRAFI